LRLSLSLLFKLIAIIANYFFFEASNLAHIPSLTKSIAIFKEAEQKVLAIKDVKEDKLESVIELIVERIVNSNGNS